MKRREAGRDLSPARRAGLPEAGRVEGVVTLVQEDRFRLEDDRGRGYLFTLWYASGVSPDLLDRWSGCRARIAVEYRGAPDLGAVALSVRERR
jgi:hypothetical protein